MLPSNYLTMEQRNQDKVESLTLSKEEERDKVIKLKSYEDKDLEEYGVEFERKLYKEKSKKVRTTI